MKSNQKQAIYVRLNTLKADYKEIEDLGLESTVVPNVYKIKNVSNRTNKLILKKHGDVVKIQNLSSCLPAFILNPKENSTVIDATASPGNKTTHLCAIMNNTGKIIAVERNLNRYKTLKSMIKEFGAKNVETIHKDFLKIEPSSIKADYILLDPSCSGSGIHDDYKKNKKRIESLKNLQSMLLNHALKFNCKKVVYSTCSIHPEEGEMVIQEALSKFENYELEKIDSFWKQRGNKKFTFSDYVIRSDKNNDTIGFFVALLKRKD